MAKQSQKRSKSGCHSKYICAVIFEFFNWFSDSQALSSSAFNLFSRIFLRIWGFVYESSEKCIQRGRFMSLFILNETCKDETRTVNHRDQPNGPKKNKPAHPTKSTPDKQKRMSKRTSNLKYNSRNERTRKNPKPTKNQKKINPTHKRTNSFPSLPSQRRSQPFGVSWHRLRALDPFLLWRADQATETITVVLLTVSMFLELSISQ